MSAAVHANAVRQPDQAPVIVSPVERRLPPINSFIEPLPTSLQTYADLDQLADRVALLLDGRGYDLMPGMGCFAHTDTFPKVTVYARGATKADAEWLGAAVLLSRAGRLEDLDRLQTAIDAALRRRGQ
jgi:hypothetical protein